MKSVSRSLPSCFSSLFRKAAAVACLTTAFMHGSAFGADWKSYHAEWGYPGQPENTSGFTMWMRAPGATEYTNLGGVDANTYAYDFNGPTEERFYASVTADFTDSTNVRSAEIPVLSLDGNLLTTEPSIMNTITLPTGTRLDALMDTDSTYVTGLVSDPPTGFTTYNSGANRYFGNHFEQLYLSTTKTQLLIAPISDFTGTPLTPSTSIYYGSAVYITGYMRNVGPTTATAPDINGVQRPIHAVVVAEKPTYGDICRVNYTASTNDALQLTRIYPYATNYTTKMDAVDYELTTHNFYLDPNGAQWYSGVSANGRKMRIRKWSGQNQELASVNIDFDKFVVGGKTLASVPASQKLFKYVRHPAGAHFILAKVDGGAIVTYPLSSDGNLMLDAAGTGVQKIVQGPFAAGAAELVDATPAVGSNRFNLVWGYPYGTSTVPAGTYSIWDTDQYTHYSSYFRIYPTDYLAKWNPQKEAGAYYAQQRVWPRSGQHFYAINQEPKTNGASPQGGLFADAGKIKTRGKAFPVQGSWRSGETYIVEGMAPFTPVFKPGAPQPYTHSIN